MIPKTIHYCWFGRGEKSVLIAKCIKSWKKICPDYHIVEWNEDNFDLAQAPDYVRQAYDAKKWAFVSDYARLKIVYENGGIYLDTDVELLRPLTAFLEYTAFFGTESPEIVSTGLGFGAEKGADVLQRIMQRYDSIDFDPENVLACPYIDTPAFENMGWKKDGTKQVLGGNVLVLSPEYLCPKALMTGIVNLTPNTYAIHHYTATWQTRQNRDFHDKQVRHNRRMIAIEYIVHIPNRILRTCLGITNYEKLKSTLKRFVKHN